ncbi:MAG: hypothetical protein C4340_05275 [Armatimonadota bacterium]
MMTMQRSRAMLSLAITTCLITSCGCNRNQAAEPILAPKRPADESVAQPEANQTEAATFIGVWRLEPGEDLVAAAQKVGRAVPSMELEAYADGTFDLVGRVGDSEFEVSGEWFVSGREVTLRAKEISGDAPILQSETEPRGGTISEDGKLFVDAGGWVWKRAKS